LDHATEAEELQEMLERMQNLSLEISEELDAYQDRHAREGFADRGRLRGGSSDSMTKQPRRCSS
jgi:hypothetical protein